MGKLEGTGLAFDQDRRTQVALQQLHQKYLFVRSRLGRMEYFRLGITPEHASEWREGRSGRSDGRGRARKGEATLGMPSLFFPACDFCPPSHVARSPERSEFEAMRWSSVKPKGPVHYGMRATHRYVKYIPRGPALSSVHGVQHEEDHNQPVARLSNREHMPADHPPIITTLSDVVIRVITAESGTAAGGQAGEVGVPGWFIVRQHTSGSRS